MTTSAMQRSGHFFPFPVPSMHAASGMLLDWTNLLQCMLGFRCHVDAPVNRLPQSYSQRIDWWPVMVHRLTRHSVIFGGVLCSSRGQRCDDSRRWLRDFDDVMII